MSSACLPKTNKRACCYIPTFESEECPCPIVELCQDEDEFLQEIAHYYNNVELSDITILVGATRYYAHKFILGKSSPQFRSLLFDYQGKANLPSEMELKESPEGAAVFGVFLKYMYTGHAEVTDGSAIGILCLSHKYDVTVLKRLVVDYMTVRSKHPNVENALQWFAWAKALNLEEVVKECWETIFKNAELIVDSYNWCELDMCFIKELLNCSELVISSEFKLYKAVTRWLLDATRVSKIQENAIILLPLIRFPMMQICELYQVENGELSQLEKTCAIIFDLVGRAYRFHSLEPTQTGVDVRFENDFYRPRCYQPPCCRPAFDPCLRQTQPQAGTGYNSQARLCACPPKPKMECPPPPEPTCRSSASINKCKPPPRNPCVATRGRCPANAQRYSCPDECGGTPQLSSRRTNDCIFNTSKSNTSNEDDCCDGSNQTYNNANLGVGANFREDNDKGESKPNTRGKKQQPEQNPRVYYGGNNVQPSIYENRPTNDGQ